MRRRDLSAACAALLTLAALAGCATPPLAAPRDWFIFLETGRKTPDDRAAVAAMQRGHIDNFKRLFGEGPVAEVLFARSTDSAALQAAFAGLPGSGEVAVWGQWLSPGVVR